MLSEKSLPQRARETVEWTWHNGVKALSWKKCMRLMVMYLAVSAPYASNAVKIYGKNGCSIDSQLIIDKYPLGYEDERRIVKERFEQTFPTLVERYAKNPCDKKYEKIQVTFIPDSRLKNGYIHRDNPTHVFLKPGITNFESIVLHEFSHVPQDIIFNPKEVGISEALSNYFRKYLVGNTRMALYWLEEAQVNYNLLLYGTEQDTKDLRLPPNLASFDDYTTIYPGIAGGFMLWLDKKFPGFVDKSSQIAQEKHISWQDLEKLTNGQSLEKLWRKYEKIDFATEMSQFLEEQRQKYLGSDQSSSGGSDRDLTENIEKVKKVEDTENAKNDKKVEGVETAANITVFLTFAYIIYRIRNNLLKRQIEQVAGEWDQFRLDQPIARQIEQVAGRWNQDRQRWQGAGEWDQDRPIGQVAGRWNQDRQRWQGAGEWDQDRLNQPIDRPIGQEPNEMAMWYQCLRSSLSGV